MTEWMGLPVVEKYKDLCLKDLPLNHAYVIANTTVDSVGVYGVNNNCLNCPYKLQKQLRAHKEVAWEVDTSVQTTWTIMRTEPREYMARNNPKGLLCIMRPTFHEYGVYRLDVGQCEVKPEVPPVNTYLPLLLCSLLLLTSGIIYAFIKFMLNSKKNKIDNENEKTLQINSEKRSDKNFNCLSVFRGVLLLLIIFITTGGGGYPVFNNEWKGLSLAECLFCGYAWTVGVNIPLVMEKAFVQRTKCYILRDILMRSFLLTVLGTVIDSTIGNHTHANHVNIWCPLQRIGVAYFIVASLYVLTVQKFEMKSKKMINKIIKNVISLLWCWIISVFLLAVMAIFISTIISFNCLYNVNLDKRDVEIITEGTENCNNAFTAYINKIFMADPEKTVDVNSYVGFSRGIMGIMSTILQLMIGLKSGVVHLHYKSHSDRLKLWSFWATLFSVGGILFAVTSCLFTFNLWPLATILLTSTSALYFFVITYIITDIWQITSSILTSTGVTSLAILSGHLLFSYSVPLSWQMHFSNHLVYLLQNIWIVGVWSIVGIMLMRKKVRFGI